MLSLIDIQERMAKLKNWGLNGNSISCDRFFGSFKGAMEFTNKVAEISEKNNHHPMIIIDNKRVRITLTTHEAKGLTEKDFDVAEEIDKI